MGIVDKARAAGREQEARIAADRARKAKDAAEKKEHERYAEIMRRQAAVLRKGGKR